MGLIPECSAPAGGEVPSLGSHVQVDFAFFPPATESERRSVGSGRS
jgi:hypothetical protein